MKLVISVDLKKLTLERGDDRDPIEKAKEHIVIALDQMMANEGIREIDMKTANFTVGTVRRERGDG